MSDNNQVFLRIAPSFKHDYQIKGEVVESLDMQWHPLDSYRASCNIEEEFTHLDIGWFLWVMKEYSWPTTVSLEIDESSDLFKKAVESCKERDITLVRVAISNDDEVIYEKIA